MTANLTTQFLTFIVDKEKYALNVSRVREILEYGNITRIPGMETFMKGIINLRGEVVPVIDLRAKFGLPENDQTKESSIIVSEIEKEGGFIITGLLTDSVEEVIDMDESSIEPAPKIGTTVNSQFIKGMGKHNEDFLIILDPDNLFRDQEISNLEQIGKTKSNGKEGD